MRKALGPIGFCLCLLLGSTVMVDSWNGAVFVYLGERRSPAAVRSMRDYSAIDRKALFSSVHRQMLEGAKIIKQQGQMALTLGHPLMKSSERNEFACSVEGRPGLFDRVELSFTGTGISESGHQPMMTVESKCGSGGNLSELETIYIPMQDIVAAEAKDQEMQIFGDHPVMVRFNHIPGEWPTGWVLSKVRFFREDDGEESLTIDADKMRENTGTGKLLSFDWK